MATRFGAVLGVAERSVEGAHFGLVRCRGEVGSPPEAEITSSAFETVHEQAANSLPSCGGVDTNMLHLGLCCVVGPDATHPDEVGLVLHDEELAVVVEEVSLDKATNRRRSIPHPTAAR